MPELPEVETIKRGLQEKIIGKKIKRFEKMGEKVVQFDPSDIEGASFKDIERVAKMLLFHLDNDKSILTHLKMTGQLIWQSCEEKEVCEKSRVVGGHPNDDMKASMPTSATRGVFHLDDGSVLYFNCQRKFGYMKLYDTDDIFETKELKGIGVDPFSGEFSVEYLMKKANRFSRRKVKQLLMDQKIVAGIGNIYADETLFYAGVMPTRRAAEVKKSEWNKIVEGARKSMKQALRHGGSSPDDYVNHEGVPGEAHKYLDVYGREGESCKGCGGKVEKMKVGGRGTHYCPKCQS